MWSWHKSRKMDQCSRKESPSKTHTPMGQLIFDKEDKNIQWGKDSPFSKWCWESWKAAHI